MKRLLVTFEKQVAFVSGLEWILAGMTPVAMGFFKVNQIKERNIEPKPHL